MSETEFKIDEQKLEVVISRVFNGSRERLWDAFTDPDMVAKWWGPQDYKMTVEKLEAKEGGKWRILHVDLDGHEHWFHGEYKEVVKPEKITRTFIYEPAPDDVLEESTVFEEVDSNKTRLIMISQFPSLEALKAMTGAGMEWGSRQSIERLSNLIENR